MKRVEAIIRHHRLDDVKNALVEKGFTGMTVSEVRGFGRQRGQNETYRGAEYCIEFVPKIRIELIIPDRLTHTAVETIIGAAQTGKVGDGKVFISDVSEVIRIRTGEVQQHAL